MSSAASRGSGSSEAEQPCSVLLERFKNGEITFDAFVEGKVDEQVAKVGQHVPEEHREFFREFLRQHILTSPVLAEYLKLMTGIDPREGDSANPPVRR